MADYQFRADTTDTVQLLDGRTVLAAFAVVQQLDSGGVAWITCKGTEAVEGFGVDTIELRVMGDPRVTSADTAQIDVDAMLAYGLERAVQADIPIPETPRPAKTSKHAQSNARARLRRDDRRLQEIADVYRSGLPDGKPTKAVQEHLGVSRAAASQWVKSARDRGFIYEDAPHRPS